MDWVFCVLRCLSLQFYCFAREDRNFFAFALLFYYVVFTIGKFLSDDLLKGLMMIGAGYGLQQIDSSRLYHSIRGQSALKLYVIYNVLEVADKLCCSFGLDILDSFFSKEPEEGECINRIKPIPHFLLTVCYVFVHSLIVFYQVITLNVAINSYSNALLTLLVSNQFVEIKSAVFKKFEKENLFQLACADIIERFQLSLYLGIIAFRNLTEMRNSLDSRFLVDQLLWPLGIVYLSEILVDWMKHAFITKFNHIQPEVYVGFADILVKDFEVVAADDEAGSKLANRSPQVSRRIGFSAFPLSCLLIRVLIQHVMTSGIPLPVLLPHFLGIFACLFVFKMILGVSLASYCHRRTSQGEAALHQTANLHAKKKLSLVHTSLACEDAGGPNSRKSGEASAYTSLGSMAASTLSHSTSFDTLYLRKKSKSTSEL